MNSKLIRGWFIRGVIITAVATIVVKIGAKRVDYFNDNEINEIKQSLLKEDNLNRKIGHISQIQPSLSGSEKTVVDGVPEGVYYFTIKSDSGSFKIRANWQSQGDSLKIISYELD